MAHAKMRQQTRVVGSRGLMLCVCAAGLIVTAGGLVGCASPVARYQSGVWVGEQGGSSEVVFDGEGVIAAREGNGVEVAVAPWRDASLSIRGAQEEYARAAWPEWNRHGPRVDRPGRVWFTNQSESFVYFRQEGVQYRGERRYWVP